MFSRMTGAGHTVAAIVTGLSLVLGTPVLADGLHPTPDDVLNDVRTTLGGVPGFVSALPKAGLAGAWIEERDLELSADTALDGKTKALISLAVAAQIPCQYCIWSDTKAARQFGASDEEIGEAVAMAGLTRNWSTLFNGLQIDFEQFKKDMGGQ